MADFTGYHGTRFECDDYAHSEHPVVVTTPEGELITIPFSDLIAFVQDVKRRIGEEPIDLHERATKYLHCAIEAAIEGERTRLHFAIAQQVMLNKIHRNVEEAVMKAIDNPSYFAWASSASNVFSTSR